MPQRTGPDSSLRMIDAGRDRRIARILRALNEQPDLRAAELAPLVELTASHVERLFKKHAGTTIGKYSMELRLLRARERLQTTFDPIKRIAIEVGLPDPANFSRRFKKRFGCTPSACRNRINARLDQQIAVSTNKTELRPSSPVVSTAQLDGSGNNR